MNNSKYSRVNRILAGVVFLFSFVVYYDTMAPTVSFWDCGEFIATAHTLGVPHPPGSPLFLIIGRIFSMIPFNQDIAFRVNLISVLVSALAVMLLYLIIVKVVAHWRKGITEKRDAIIAEPLLCYYVNLYRLIPLALEVGNSGRCVPPLGYR